MKLQELFNTLPLEEGPNDPNINKAILMVGGPGSGKSYVVNEIIKGTGLKVVNSDIFFEYLAKKMNKPELLGSEASLDKKELRDKARDLKNKQLNQYLDGHLGLVIDGTGRNYERTVSNYQKLKKLGYEVLVLAINTDLETAAKRNQARDRKVPDEFLKKAHKQVTNNLGKFMGYFGSDLLLIDNSEDSHTDFNLVWKKIQKFLNTTAHKKLGEDYEPRYITDNNDQNPDQHEKDKTYAIKLAKFIIEHCQPWLNQTDNGKNYVYRGTKSIKGSNIPKVIALYIVTLKQKKEKGKRKKRKS